MIDRGSWNTQRKPAPVSLCPPQMPQDLTGCEPGATALGRQRLTAWAMARSRSSELYVSYRYSAINVVCILHVLLLGHNPHMREDYWPLNPRVRFMTRQYRHTRQNICTGPGTASAADNNQVVTCSALCGREYRMPKNVLTSWLLLRGVTANCTVSYRAIKTRDHNMFSCYIWASCCISYIIMIYSGSFAVTSTVLIYSHLYFILIIFMKCP
jgi:hypothetical protein